MAKTNSNINKAKSEKNDEFYTMMPDIEKEMEHYRNYFKGKVIYCNCDDVRHSNFVRYFMENFESLGLKKLVSTGYSKNGKGILFTCDGEKSFTGNLKGDGDFRSDECIQYLKEADIVATNPPFSLFREYIAQLLGRGKKFIIIGNNNAITYKEVFPYIMNGKLWLGRTLFTGKMPFFEIPDSFETTNDRVYEKDGKRYKQVNGVCWFTNIDNGRKETSLTLTKDFSRENYQKFDSLEAINVGFVKDIPYNYDGVIGMPITGLKYLYPDGYIHFNTPMFAETDSRYKIIGEINHGSDSEYDIAKCVVNGKEIFKRIAIQKVK